MYCYMNVSEKPLHESIKTFQSVGLSWQSGLVYHFEIPMNTAVKVYVYSTTK